jgi:hypothetical protein
MLTEIKKNIHHNVLISCDIPIRGAEIFSSPQIRFNTKCTSINPIPFTRMNKAWHGIQLKLLSKNMLQQNNYFNNSIQILDNRN